MIRRGPLGRTLVGQALFVYIATAAAATTTTTSFAPTLIFALLHTGEGLLL